MTDEPRHAWSPARTLWTCAAVSAAVSAVVFGVGTWVVILPRLEAHEQRLADVEELVAEDEPIGDETADAGPSAALPADLGRER